MKLRSRSRAALLGAAIVTAGIFVAPQPASAYGITECSFQRPLSFPTWFAVRCKGSFLDSDLYAAHIRCNGTHYATGNYSTPTFGGWGPWAYIECPSGATWSSAWHTTSN